MIESTSRSGIKHGRIFPHLMFMRNLVVKYGFFHHEASETQGLLISVAIALHDVADMEGEARCELSPFLVDVILEDLSFLDGIQNLSILLFGMSFSPVSVSDPVNVHHSVESFFPF